MSTTPIYQMFDIIAQSGVGNLGNSSLICLQLMVSLLFECKFLFSGMKKKPPLVQLSVAMIPMLLIATYFIVCGLFFSAFLGKGPTVSEMTNLIGVTLTERSVSDMLLTTVVFFVLMFLYSTVYRLNPLQWLVTFGLETLAAFSLCVLYGGLRIKSFPYTILDLCERNLYLARWPIYGYFTVLFKCFVLLMCLLLGFFLREREEKQESGEEIYHDRRGYYERKTLRYLTKNDALIGGSLLLFGVAAEVFFWYALQRDAAAIWNVDTIITMIFFAAMFAAPSVIGVCLLYRALYPRTCVAYRQLLAMGNQDTVLRLFCEEIVDSKEPATNLWTSRTQMLQTAHFLYWQQGVKPRVQWRGEHLREELRL